MAKNFKRLLFVFAVMAIMIAALAMTVSAEVFSVTENDSTITFDSESGVMTISFIGNPANLGWWWEFKPNLTETANFIATHKDSVQHIEIDYYKRIQYGSAFFDGMTNLVSIHFKDNGSGVGPNIKDALYFGNLFNGCESLTTVWVGDTKTENVVNLSGLSFNDPIVSTNAFQNCYAMKALVLPEDAMVAALDASIFSGCTALEYVHIPSTVTSIADDTFAGLENFKYIVAPEGSYAQQWAEEKGYVEETTTTFFSVTENDSTITFDSESGVMTISFIGNPADHGWWWQFRPNLTETAEFIATHKDSVQHIEIDYYKEIPYNSAFFDGMKNLVSVHFKANDSGNGPQIKDALYFGNLFNGCESLTTVWVGDTKTENVVDLSKISFTDPIVSTKAFQNCYAMKALVLPESAKVTALDASIFSGCTALETVHVPSTVTSIADDTFASLTNLKSIIAPFGSAAQEWATANNLFPTIWDRKPTTAPVASGYCTSGAYNTYCNAKWELHNLGTASNPEYALYFSIDSSSSYSNCGGGLPTHMTSQGTPSSTGNNYGWGNSDGAEKNHPWYDASTFGNIKYISIDEGFEWFVGATFVGMSSVEVIELPASMRYYEGPHFKNMSSLTTVYTRGQAFEVGTVDLSYVNTFQPWKSGYMFAGLSSVKKYNLCSAYTNANTTIDSTDFMNNTSLEEVIFTANGGLTAIGANAFSGCPSLKKLTIPDAITSIDPTAFPDSNSVEWVEASVGSVGHAFALSKGWNTNHTMVYDGLIYTYDPDTKTVSFDADPTVSWAQITMPGSRTQTNTFLDIYKNYAEKAYFGSVGKFRFWSNSGDADYFAIFDAWPLLKEVHFAEESYRIEMYAGYGDYFFKDCPNLTTIWCGDISNRVEGTAVLPATVNCDQSNCYDEYMNKLIYGCSAIRKVVVPAVASALTANSFYGCTSLEEITIPASVTGIADGAFSTCTSLRKINLAAPASIVTAGSVNGAQGLVIFAQSTADADTINNNLTAAGVPTTSAFAFYKTGMSIGGYSVRTTEKNGLRTHFIFDDDAVSGYNLVEYGTLSATATTWANYSQSFGADNSVLKLDGGEFVTPDNVKIVKTPIYQNGNYVNNSVELANGNRSFSVTIVNFKGDAQIKAELVSAGYEIWEKNGNYYVLFTREDAYGYDTISLYKTTLGMLSDEFISISMDENDPVWGTLNACEKTEVTTSDADITAYTFADPINEGKVIAIYLTTSENEVPLTDFGFAYDNRDHISTFIFGKNVKYDLPIVDGYWETHLKEQMANIPEGKSFIAYTDTHFQSGDLPVRDVETRNNRKLADLIEYVRINTGIDTVLNLGDPYSGEPTVEGAKEMMKASVKDAFFDKFGADALFAVGNHDANKTAESYFESGTPAYEYLLPDSVIYEYGFKPLEGKVVWDSGMLALVDQFDYTEAIANTGNKFTEEQFKAEFIAWAKQHYHYDDTEAKIRYISVNTGNCGIVETYLFDDMLYGDVLPAQYDWLYNVLTTTPEGYDIVIMGHMFSSNTVENQSGGWLFHFLSAFSGGYDMTVGGMNGGSANRNLLYGNPEGADSKTYNFSGSYDGTLFTIGGHWHQNLTRVWGNSGKNVDYIEGNSYGSNDVFIISIAEDGIDNPDSFGNISENGFAIVTITDDNQIVITGIGDVSSRTVKK